MTARRLIVVYVLAFAIGTASLAALIITLDIAVNLSVGFREYHQSGRCTYR